MNLHKINNFALKLALALGFAGASALSSLSVVQAQTTPYPTGRSQGYQQRDVAQQQYYRQHYRQRYYYPMQQRQQQRYYYPPPQRQQQQYYYPPPQRQQQQYYYPPTQGQQPQYFVPPPETPMGTDPYKIGNYWGQEDGHDRQEFRPCQHIEFTNGDLLFRRAFTKGYLEGYFSARP